VNIVAVSSALAASLLGFAPASSGDLPAARRLELRVETVVDREGAPIESCEVSQVNGAGLSISFASWGAVGATCRCGVGPYPGVAPAATGATLAPVEIHEISAVAGWDSGTMDPGAVGAVQISLTLLSRHQPDGNPVKQIRSIRLEPGEEFVLPVPLEPDALATLRAHEVLLRFRAGWVGRERATHYGAIAVMEAAPGSEVVLDGGVAGRVAADGTLRLANVPEGLREVAMRSASGPIVSRIVSVVKGRTVPAAPEAADSWSPPSPTVTSTGKNAEGFQEYRRVRDGAVMIHIPEGEFLMGNLETEGAPLPHTVRESSFLIDKLPLTVGPFKRFAAATGRPLPPDPYWGVHDDFPVAFIRWDEAKAYCEWAGGRLPTEAEREKATRGTDGRMWPWGSEPPAPARGVFRRNWGQEGNDAVGSRPAGASPYGLLDTGGNMWEFCEDWWAPDYFKSSPPADPAGPKSGRARVVKGGSWDSRPTVLSASSRNFAYVGYREGDFGFRCASDLPR
jgi:formylglycine-generating enzyme required for sulfatase activity